jgi:hypothetical protein
VPGHKRLGRARAVIISVIRERRLQRRRRALLALASGKDHGTRGQQEHSGGQGAGQHRPPAGASRLARSPASRRRVSKRRNWISLRARLKASRQGTGQGRLARHLGALWTVIYGFPPRLGLPRPARIFESTGEVDGRLERVQSATAGAFESGRARGPSAKRVRQRYVPARIVPVHAATSSPRAWR